MSQKYLKETAVVWTEDVCNADSYFRAIASYRDLYILEYNTVFSKRIKLKINKLMNKLKHFYTFILTGFGYSPLTSENEL